MSRLWRPLVLLSAVLALLVAYFWVHKPFDPQLALSLSGLILDVVTVALIIVFTGGIGRRMLALLVGAQHAAPLRDTTAILERLALSSGLGMGLYSLAALLLGLAGLYRGVVLWGVLLIGAVICLPGVIAWLGDFRACLRHATHAETPWTRFLMLIAWITLFTAALFAFAPPVGWDSLTYHLVAPQRYLDAGRIDAQPDNFYLGLSQGMEMLYAAAMSLFGRDTAAAPLHWWLGVTGIIALAGLVRRHTDTNAAWIAVILPLSAFSVWVLLGYAYVDLAVMAYSALALVAVLRWIETDQQNWLLLAGIFVGLAMGVKYTAGLLFISIVLLVAWHLRGDWRRMLRPVAFVGLAALFVFLPWMLKGVLLYDNPVYPLFFDGLNWDSFRTDYFNPPATGLIQRGEAWHIPIMPLVATVFGVEKGDGYAFTAGLWLLTSPLLLILVWRYLTATTKSLAVMAFVFVLPLLIYWMLMAAYYEVSIQARLMTMLFPPFIVMGALGFYGLRRLSKKPLDIHFIVQAMLVITLSVGVFDVVRFTVGSRVLDYHIAAEFDRDDFILRDGRVAGVYNVFLHMETLQSRGDLPRNARVRLLWEPKVYYCPSTIECVGDPLLDHWRHPIDLGLSPDDIFERWRQQGDDYVLVWESGLNFAVDIQPERFPGSDLFRPALERHMTPVWTNGADYTLYAWQIARE